jgi:hypothetical protein
MFIGLMLDVIGSVLDDCLSAPDDFYLSMLDVLSVHGSIFYLTMLDNFVPSKI